MTQTKQPPANPARFKIRTLFEPQNVEAGSLAAGWLITPEGEYRGVTAEEEAEEKQLPAGSRLYKPDNLQSQGAASAPQVFTHEGKEYEPNSNNHWKPNFPIGLNRLAKSGRIHVAKGSIQYRRYADDFPLKARGNIWTDTLTGSFTGSKLYAVMTNPKVIERCLLLSTDPGDLVLDPTCGSGTTAYVAEQLGRRWITVDTSRVAVAIARQRLMTAKFEHYRLKEPEKGVAGGFVYKTVPHITLGAIARNTALDPIFAKHQPILDARLADLNTALNGVGDNIRAHLAAKLTAKQKAEGKRKITEGDRRRWLLPKAKEGFQHWTAPFGPDPDYPQDLADAVTAYRAAWRTKQDEVNECIAKDAQPEDLVDQPDPIHGVVRVSGPFTVEAVQPVETSLDDITQDSPIAGEPDGLMDTFEGTDASGSAQMEPQNAEAYLDRMVKLMRLDGVSFTGNKSNQFSRLELLSGTASGIHAEGRWHTAGETDPDPDGDPTVAVAFGPQYGPVTAKQVEDLIRSCARRGYDHLVIAGFSFDGAAQAIIAQDAHPKLRIHLAHIRPDTSPGMAGLIKDTPKSQLFTVFGKPRSKPERVNDKEWRILLEGVDVYDPLTGTITPTSQDKVAAWFIDSDYDGRTFCITQAFFPDRDAWDKLERALGGIIPSEAFEALAGTESLPFPKGKHGMVAVKVIDPRGNEVLGIHRLED